MLSRAPEIKHSVPEGAQTLRSTLAEPSHRLANVSILSDDTRKLGPRQLLLASIATFSIKPLLSPHFLAVTPTCWPGGFARVDGAADTSVSCASSTVTPASTAAQKLKACDKEHNRRL